MIVFHISKSFSVIEIKSRLCGYLSVEGRVERSLQHVMPPKPTGELGLGGQQRGLGNQESVLSEGRGDIRRVGKKCSLPTSLFCLDRIDIQ